MQRLLKLFRTEKGKIILSIIIGVGIASLFRKACTDRKQCIVFKGPNLDELHKNIYRHDNKCYSFKEKSTKCGSAHKKVEFELKGGDAI
jgi:hypothetical protein